MRNILDVPTELLHRIVHFLSPTDFEALISSNKIIYDSTGPALRRHFRLRKRYEVCAFENSCHIADDNRHALLLLGTILENPDVASYPITLKTDRGRSGYNKDQDLVLKDVMDKKSMVIAKHSVRLAKVVEESGFISNPNLMEKMSDSSREWRINASFCLLITLLPRLECLEFYGWDSLAGPLPSIVQKVTNANRDPQSPLNAVALSQLREIFLCDTDIWIGDGVHDCVSFLMLPSMCRFRGRQIDAIGYPRPTSLPLYSSTVTDIELKNSSLHAWDIDILLSSIAALKKFTYEHGGITVGESAYQPVAIVDALRKHASHSLKLLDIETIASNEDYVGFSDEEAMGSLRMFTRLEIIRLETTNFIHSGCEESETSEAPSEDHLHWDGDEPPETDFLINVLPASVKAFTLKMLDGGTNTSTLLTGLAEWKAKKLPRLDSLTFEAFEAEDPLESDTKEALKASGIKLWSRSTAL
ncbi:MAG: hypothetical protein LQ352_003059 [Teloschistes flavicans]|nr:MAG: hypothetical protein LQ352_003059 [Teloschistes flavicans]